MCITVHNYIHLFISLIQIVCGTKLALSTNPEFWVPSAKSQQTNQKKKITEAPAAINGMYIINNSTQKIHT